MTTEILINIAVMLIAIVALVAIVLRIMNGKMDDSEETPEPTGQDNAPQPPPEPEH